MKLNGTCWFSRIDILSVSGCDKPIWTKLGSVLVYKGCPLRYFAEGRDFHCFPLSVRIAAPFSEWYTEDGLT